MDVLKLVFCAPLMSFGDIAIDDVIRTGEVPQRSSLTGLIGNAFGWTYKDASRLTRLQSRIRFAARQDLPGERIVDDVQTALNGQDHCEYVVMHSTFAEVFKPKEMRLRSKQYLAGAKYTVAMYLIPAEEEPTLQDVAKALEEPERTLYIGRRCCVPTERISQGIVQVSSLGEALHTTDRMKVFWMTGEEGFPSSVQTKRSFGNRDWKIGVHTGFSTLQEGYYGT